MRESRTYGSEGGEAGNTVFPTPYHTGAWIETTPLVHGE